MSPWTTASLMLALLLPSVPCSVLYSNMILCFQQLQMSSLHLFLYLAYLNLKVQCNKKWLKCKLICCFWIVFSLCFPSLSRNYIGQFQKLNRLAWKKSWKVNFIGTAFPFQSHLKLNQINMLYILFWQFCYTLSLMSCQANECKYGDLLLRELYSWSLNAQIY